MRTDPTDEGIEGESELSSLSPNNQSNAMRACMPGYVLVPNDDL
jgi:hypothetical protein